MSLKNLYILFASLAFFTYGSKKYVILLLISILINYICALMVEDAEGRGKKTCLGIGVVLNLALLFYFKYFMFVLGTIDSLSGADISVPNIVLPIGISFYTFQGMSYLIDVYRGTVTANKNFLEIALYIALFPQLIAGPIVKYKDIFVQIKNHPTSAPLFAEGISRFIIGLSKKLLIADVLGVQCEKIYAAYQYGVDAPSVWLAVLCYMFQIYFDFSGYSDMAIGLCKMFGFRLNENFNYPYISRSITEFWRRWHISLSTWFKEYLYIPLGGNRRGNVYLHLFIVFCATGIWHGAAWQFLAWGLWHGAFILIEKYAKHELTPDGIPKYASVVPHYAIKALRWFTTMLVVYFGWLLFSADGIHHAFDLFRTMFGIEQAGHVSLTWAYYFDHKIVFTLIIAAIGATPLVKTLGERWTRRFGEIGRNIGRIVLFACLIICVLSAVGGTYSPFIYFRF